MQKLIIPLLALIYFSLSVNAQVLLPTSETAFEKQHSFNPEIIKKRNIKRIVFEIADKKDFEGVVDKNLTENYEFDTNGMLSRYYYTTIVRTNERIVTIPAKHKGRRKIRDAETKIISDYVYDTISTWYLYNNKQQLILKRYHDGLNYYESKYYRYNSENQLTKELKFKETNISKDKSIFILGNQVLLSEDSFQYNKYSNGQTKCTLLNNENRPYKENLINYDANGNKIKQFESYTAASWIVQEQKFEYLNNRLSKAEYSGNANTTFTIANTYEFDENKELLTEKQYKNNVMIKEISYVTDSNNKLLNSYVARDPINKSIRIVKLKYDFGALSSSRK